MTFWVIRQGKPGGRGMVPQHTLDQIGRGPGVGGVLALEAGASAMAYATVAGSGGRPVYVL